MAVEDTHVDGCIYEGHMTSPLVPEGVTDATSLGEVCVSDCLLDLES